MKYDAYYTVENGKDTYKDISDILQDKKSLFFSWTDRAGTMFDILMIVHPNTLEHNSSLFQSGRRSSNLFVSVMGVGAESFVGENRKEPLHPNYISEKLGVGNGKTGEELGKLITGVIQAYYGG